MGSSMWIEGDALFLSSVFVRWGMARMIASAFSIELKALEALKLGKKFLFFDVRRTACKSSEIVRARLTDRGRMYRFQDPSDILEE